MSKTASFSLSLPRLSSDVAPDDYSSNSQVHLAGHRDSQTIQKSSPPSTASPP